jgi:type I restriction enzyme S subunit
VRRNELSLDDVAYVTAPDTAEAKRTRVEHGDVLLSITADLGRTAVVPKGLGAAYINQHLAILRTKSFVPRFLSAYLASPSGRSQLMRQNRQAVKAGLNFDDIRSVVVPFPPVTAQGKFEAMAAKVETLERAQSEVLTQLDSLFASLQHRAFRGDLPANLEALSGDTHALGR